MLPPDAFFWPENALKCVCGRGPAGVLNCPAGERCKRLISASSVEKKIRFRVSKQSAFVHSVGAILLSTTLPRAIFACSILYVPDAACSPGHFHNIVLIICQFSTVLLSISFSNRLYSNNHHHYHIQVVRCSISLYSKKVTVQNDEWDI